MHIIAVLVAALKNKDSRAIDAVASIIRRVKIVDLTEREIDLLVKLLHDADYQNCEQID